MNLFLKLSSLLLVTTMMVVPCIEAHDKHEKVKYVQGGSCEPGTGSKKHPYTSLQQAQDNTADWDVLIVLSSTTPLDGGITLKDGQKLIGEEDPTCIALSPTQPTITNTDTTLVMNGGNGVVVESGDATIENIYFTNIQASAIKYDNARNLIVKNVLITNYNVADDNYPGISAVCTTSGKAHIHHTVVRNAFNGTFNGRGIYEEAQSGVHRELSVCTSEFADLDNADGIFVVTLANGSSEVLIKDCYFHDNLDEGLELNNAGGVQKALVKDSVFKNLGGLDTFNANGGSIKLKVDSCLFENTDDSVIEVIDRDSSSEIVVENSVINSPGEDAVTTLIRDASGNSVQKICLINNTITADTFYEASNSSITQSGRTEVVIRDNFIRAFVGIEIDAESPWTLLNIEAEHNCFEGYGFDLALSSSSGVAGAGNATIHAHKNSFSGFLPDIKDFNANTGVFYDVTKNWWGHGVPVACTPGSCVFAQTCTNGFCQGPVVVGTMNVNANDPLTESIKCPHNCCKRLPTPPTTPPQATVTSAAERRMEKREKKVAKMKARQEQIKLS